MAFFHFIFKCTYKSEYFSSLYINFLHAFLFSLLFNSFTYICEHFFLQALSDILADSHCGTYGLSATTSADQI